MSRAEEKEGEELGESDGCMWDCGLRALPDRASSNKTWIKYVIGSLKNVMVGHALQGRQRNELNESSERLQWEAIPVVIRSAEPGNFGRLVRRPQGHLKPTRNQRRRVMMCTRGSMGKTYEAHHGRRAPCIMHPQLLATFINTTSIQCCWKLSKLKRVMKCTTRALTYGKWGPMSGIHYFYHGEAVACPGFPRHGNPTDGPYRSVFPTPGPHSLKSCFNINYWHSHFILFCLSTFPTPPLTYTLHVPCVGALTVVKHCYDLLSVVCTWFVVNVPRSSCVLGDTTLCFSPSHH